MIPVLVLSAAMASAAQWKQVVNVPIAFDGSVNTATIAQFNPLLGTLNRARVYSFVRANGTYMVENIDPIAGAGAASFSIGLNIAIDTPFGDYNAQFNGAQSKWSKIVLGAYDGTADFLGSDSWSRSFSTTAGADAGWTSDPIALGLVTGLGLVTLKLQGVYQTYWQSFTPGFPRPQQVVTAGGTQTVVVIYDYTPALP